MPTDLQGNTLLPENKENPLNIANITVNQPKKSDLDPSFVQSHLNSTPTKQPPIETIEPPQLSLDEIKDHTLIGKLAYTPIPPLRNAMKAKSEEETVIKLASNFVGGGLVTGAKDVDGIGDLPNFTAWNWLFDDIIAANTDESATSTLNEIKTGLEQLLDYIEMQEKLENLSDDREGQLHARTLEIAQKIQKLKAGEFQVIYGGWSNRGGGSGHAIVYEFARAEDGTFDIYIYTSTAFQLTSTVQKGDKRRIKPVVHYKSVQEKDILFNDDRTVRPGFIQALTELNMLALWDNNFTVDEEDVLEIFDHIAKYRVPVPLEEYGAITGQRAGTCVPSSTKAWIRGHSKNKDQYKQIMFQVKLRLLVATYDKLSDHINQDTKLGASTRVLLKQVAKKLLRRTAKCVEESSDREALINEAVAKGAIATANDILNQIDVAEKAIEKTRKTMTTDGHVYNADIATQRKQRARIHWETAGIGGLLHASPTTLPNLELTIKEDGSNLLDVINRSCASQRKLSAHYPELANLQLHHTIDQLPLPKFSEGNIESIEAPFWDQIQDQETLEKCIERLHRMASSYRLTFQEDIATRKFATIFSIQTLIHYLSLKVDALNENEHSTGRLQNYKIPYRGVLANDLEGLTFFDRKEHERFHDVSTYFKVFNQQAKRQQLFENENTTDVVKTSVNRALGNGAFWIGIARGNDALYEKLKLRANEKWKDFTLEEIDDDYQRQVNKLSEWECQQNAYLKYQEYVNQLDAYENGRTTNKPALVALAGHPGQAPQPQRLQNLPLDQKITLLMESSDSDSKTQEILREHGYSYLWELREMTYWCHEWMFNVKTPSSLRTDIVRESLYKTKTVVMKRPGTSEEQSEVVKKLGMKAHRSLRSKKYTDFFKDNSTKRDTRFWSRGVAEIRSLDQSIEDPILKRLHRNLSEWKLTPYQLVMEMGKDIESLNSPEIQTLFYRLFFRSPVSKKGEAKLGAGQLIVDDRALYDNCKAFISKGVNHFTKLEDPIKGARFFLELSFYLSKYLHDAGKDDQAKNLCSVNEIERLLKLEKLTDQDKGTLHFYRLLFYSNYPMKDLGTKEITKIYKSWVFYSLYPNDREWKSPIGYEMAKKFINKLTTNLKDGLESSAELRSALCTRILESIGVDNCTQHMNWMCDPEHGYPVFHVKTTETDFYKIDLIKGKVYTKAGEVTGVPQYYSWENQNDFKRIFGDKVNFHYRALGGGNVGFKHPEFGSFRLVCQYDGYYGYTYIIQRQFTDSSQDEQSEIWYEYKKTEGVEGFPTILYSDHTFWTPVNKYSCQYKGYIASLHTQKRKYAIKNDGKIIEIDSVSGKHNEKSRFVDADASTECLLNFDQHILRFTDRVDTIQRIQFPRYTSLEGNPLAFSEHKGQLVWNDNRQYYIPEKMPKGYLGTIPNYLYLQSRNDGKCDKLLVPLQPIGIEEVSYPNGNIRIENNRTIVPTKRSENKEMWDKFQFLVFNVENGEIEPTTQEAQLYLAYVNLSQKNYAQAIHWIKTLNPLEDLSSASQEILDLIIDLPIIEDHPEAKAVMQHAILTMMKGKDKVATEKITEYFGTNRKSVQKFWNLLARIADSYQSHNNIGIECRFTTEDEEFFLKKILIEYGEKADLIKDFLLKDQQEHIEPIISQISARHEYLQGGKGTPHDEPDTKAFRITPKSKDGRNRTNLTLAEKPYSGYRTIERMVRIPVKPILRNFFYQIRGSSETYQEALVRYNRELLEAVNWLSSGASTIQCTRPGKNVAIQKNGRLLLEASRIAKGNSQTARDEMIFKLKLWRIHSTELSHDLTIIDLMLVMLLNPNGFPEPINSWDSAEIKGLFLGDCLEGYKTHSLITSYTITEMDNPRVTRPARVDNDNFSISLTSAFDTKDKQLEDIDTQKLPLHLDLSTDQTRWDTLQEWKSHFQVSSSSAEDEVGDEDSDFTFHFNESLLSDREEEYVESLKRDLRLLEKDYIEGKSINKKVKNAYLSDEECIQLQANVTGEVESISQTLDVSMKELLEKANRYPKDVTQQLLNYARKRGTVQSEITFDDLVHCFLSQDRREYQLKNPEINDQELSDELAKLTLAVLDLKSQLAQLKRIKGLTEKIGNIKDLGDITRSYLCKKLYGELDTQYHYDSFDPDTQVVLRTFSGETGMIPFKKQTDLIKKMLELSEDDPDRFKDIVIQLIMGGGKTSVLATILMYIAARRSGRIALFIVPSSLFDTVKINLGDSLNKAFHTKLAAVDMSREQMTPYRLEQLIQTCDDAQHKNQPIVVKATTIQALELELLHQARRFKDAYIETLDFEEKLKKKQDERNEVSCRNPISRVARAEKTDLLKSLAAQEESLKIFLQSTKNRLKISETKLGLLRTIVSKLPECADALIDEVDLILDSLQEVNFPEGERVAIKIERNNLLLNIYKALSSDSLKISTLEGNPSVNDVVGLRANEQSKMDKNKYLMHVVPVIAEHLSTAFEPIEEQIPDFKESYVRYASGKIPLFLEDFITKGITLNEKNLEKEVSNWREFSTYSELENDMQFLERMTQLYNTGDEEQKEAINLMALSRHFLTELTPATLTKSGRRDYGIKPGSGGRIIPYLAVNTPATTEFGYHWEEACYYYQWAAAFSPTKEQVTEMAQSAESMARYYIQKNGEKYEDTIEFNEFQKLFNIRLDKIHEPGNMEEAIAFIEQDIEKCLDLQFENVSSHVSFNTERLTSNGTGLIHQLSSRRTMSGTPWNVEGYAKRLKERYEADLGTEGQILNALANKKKDGKIYEADLSSIDTFLTGIFENHPTPQKIRGIIEAGGLFKTFKNNLEVASHIMLFIEERQDLVDTEIEGVLFFHNDPDQDQPDTLYVWKKGATQPERIGGSSVEALKAKGLEPKKYFTLYDERHTTGTDILQLPDSINLFTFDEKMLRRTVGQGIMRLRQFLVSQDVEVVVTKKSKESIFHGGKTLNDLILHAEKVQSLRKTHDMVRYYQQQIDGIFRDIAVKKVVETIKDLKNPEQIAAVVERFEPFFVTTMVDEPFLQFGRLKRQVDTKEYLTGYLEKKLKRFTDAMLQSTAVLDSDSDSLEKAKKDTIEMKEHIQTAEGLPKQWEEPPENIGVEQEVEVQQQVEVNQQIQVNLELETEVELELQRYEAAPVTAFLDEEKMSLDALRSKIHNLKSLRPGEKSIQDQLRAYKYGFDEKPMPYHRVFSQPIYGTVSFFNTCMNTLPVFHRFQRPAKQILAVQSEGKMRWLLLSEREAKSVKAHLKELYEKNDPDAENVWLIQPDGSLFVNHENAEDFPSEEGYVDDGLLEINAFIGNADYIDKNSSDTEDWLVDFPELKVRFLKLKCARNEKQNRILRCCQVVASRDEKAKFDPNQKTFKARLEKEKLQQGTFRPDSELEAKLLTPTKIKKLNVEFVKYLGVDPDAVDECTVQALAELNEKLPPELQGSDRQQALRKAAIKHTKEQFRVLKPYHIPYVEPQHVKWLLPSQIQHLTKKEQFCTSHQDHEQTVIDEYLLTEEQVKGMDKGQKKLIAYVNPEFYKNFTHPWQVEGVAPKDIDRLSANSWIYLSKPQMKGLTREKVEDLKNISLPPEKYGWINGNLIEGIPPKFYNKIVKEQIREITEPDVVKKVEELAKTGEEHDHYNEGEWTSWILPEMIQYINFDTQMQYLKNKSQILHVPVKEVHRLDIHTQVPLIGKDQIPGLTNKQIPGCPDEHIRHLVPKQFQWLIDRQYPFLIGETQIHAVKDKEKFALLKAEENSQNKYENQMQWIHENQLGMVTIDQIKGLTIDQLLQLKDFCGDERWEEIREGMSIKQIQSLDTVELVKILSSLQIKNHLSESQVRFLEDEYQIRSCPDKLVKKLDQYQVKSIKDEQVKYLREYYQVHAIKDEQVKHLSCEFTPPDIVNQLGWMSDDQLKHIKPEQVKGLSNEQLLKLKSYVEPDWSRYSQYIIESQVDSFDTQQLFKLLDKDLINNFAKQQHVQFMKEAWQVKACPDDIVQHLDADSQVPQIQASQAKHLMGKRQIRALKQNIDCVQGLVKHQFLHMDDNQFLLVSQKQIKLFNKGSPLFNKLTPAQIQEIYQLGVIRNIPKGRINDLLHTQFALFQDEDRSMIRKLNKSQVKEITKDDTQVIANVAAKQVQYLKNETLSKLPNKVMILKGVGKNRLHHLTITQVKKRDLSSGWRVAGHVLAGLFRTLFMPLMIVVDFIINIAKTVFCTLRLIFTLKAQNGRKLFGQLKMTFLVGPAINFVAPVEIFHPAKYLQLKSKMSASCAA